MKKNQSNEERKEKERGKNKVAIVEMMNEWMNEWMLSHLQILQLLYIKCNDERRLLISIMDINVNVKIYIKRGFFVYYYY